MPQKQRKGNLKPVSSSSISAAENNVVNHPLLRTLMNKRDENTLIKALTELNAIAQMQDSSIDYQEWILIFNKLANLPFKRCRSLSVKVQGILTCKYGKAIYPFLPNAITNWMRLLFDPYVYVEANESFNACFPKPEINEINEIGEITDGGENRIWEFSQKRVLNDLLDFFKYENAESLSDLRFIDLVDAEQTFERVTESNISIIIKLLSILSQSKRERFKEEYQNLFNESKFWKLTTSQSVGVKREMYRLVGVLCDKDHELLDFSLGHIGSIWIPKIFTDSNIRNQADLWESLVKLTKIRPQVWILGSAKKPMLSKYLKFLSTGCHGLGHIIYPCQLVIFSLIPKELMNEGFLKFVTDYLAACWKGFFCKSVHNDSKEFSEMVLEVVCCCITTFNKDNQFVNPEFLKIGFIDPLFSTFEKQNLDWGVIFQKQWVKYFATMSRSSKVPESFAADLLNTVIKRADSDITCASNLYFYYNAFAKLYASLCVEPDLSSGLKRELEKKNYVVLKQLLLHLAADLESGQDLFEGCTRLLEAFNFPNCEIESILLNWIDNIPIKFYLEHPDKFPSFLSLIITICHFLDQELGKKVWKKIVSFVNSENRLDLMAELLHSSMQFEFRHDPAPGIEWIGDLEFLENVCTPSTIADILKLFEKGLTSEVLYQNILQKIQNEFISGAKQLFKNGKPPLGRVEFVLRVFTDLGYDAAKKIFSNITLIFSHVSIMALFESCISGESLKLADQIFQEWGSIIWEEFPDEVFNEISSWIKLGLSISPSQQLGSGEDYFKICKYTLNYSKKDPVCFWAEVFDNQALSRPYLWDRSLVIFHPSLLLIGNNNIKAEWFPRYIDVSYKVVELYGTNILSNNENLLLDWIRQYHFLLNSERLLLNESAVSSVQLRKMEKIIDSSILGQKWATLAIDDILNLKSQTCLGMAFKNAIFQGNEVDLLSFIWLLEKIAHLHGSAMMLPLVKYARKESEEHQILSSLIIMDGLKSLSFKELHWMEDIMDIIIGIESLTDDFSTFLILLLCLVRNNEKMLGEITDSKTELFFNHIRNKVGENGSEWCKLSENVVILLSQLFSVQIKSGITIDSEYILNWALFFTISNSHSTALQFNIFKLTEEICMESGSDLIISKDNRDELFYQALSLFVIESKSEKKLIPEKECLFCLARIANSVPESVLLESTHFEELFQILYASDFTVQLTAWNLLHRKVAVKVQSLSLLMEMNNLTDEQSLPQELTYNICQPLPTFDLTNPAGDVNSKRIVGFLFHWALIFDYLTDTTMRLKNQYISEIQNGEYIDHFLTICWDILGVGWSNSPFDLGPWDFRNLNLEIWEPAESGLPLLTAHLIWRGLIICPSLIRSWYTECKDRSLTIAVEKYIERYFSNLLIREQVVDLERRKKEIQNLTVKTSKTQREVTASYIIDEASLDILFRFPSNYPLRQIEIESGIGKVIGVPEAKWRAWILSITVLMISQNGSIYDALNVFQKNVSLHFEGVEDCAICYSIIGVLDNTLPSKQCKNCKHKFHSACLFKWFKTSGQSTCPLCRQSSF